jgi:hypothetical protein
MTHRAAAGALAQDEVYLYKTAGQGAGNASTYAADLVVIDNRDYSISESANDQQPALTAPAPGTNDGFPFVPQSSFSFQNTDTLPPEDRLAMMQVFTEKTIRTQIGQLKRELNQQLDMLRQEQSALNKATAKNANQAALARGAQSALASQKRLKLLFGEQLQLQRQYLIRLNSLQRQLQRAVHRLTTVYI